MIDSKWSGAVEVLSLARVDNRRGTDVTAVPVDVDDDRQKHSIWSSPCRNRLHTCKFAYLDLRNY